MITANRAGQRDHAIFDFNADLCSVHSGLPFEFIDHVLLQLRIGFHGEAPIAFEQARSIAGANGSVCAAADAVPPEFTLFKVCTNLNQDV